MAYLDDVPLWAYFTPLLLLPLGLALAKRKRRPAAQFAEVEMPDLLGEKTPELASLDEEVSASSSRAQTGAEPKLRRQEAGTAPSSARKRASGGDPPEIQATGHAQPEEETSAPKKRQRPARRAQPSTRVQERERTEQEPSKNIADARDFQSDEAVRGSSSDLRRRAMPFQNVVPKKRKGGAPDANTTG